MAALPRLTSQLQVAARACGAVVSVVAALLTAAGLVDNARFAWALAGFVMPLVTGVAFVLAGAALWTRARTAAVIGAVIVLGIGVFILVEQLNARGFVGRMEPETAGGFVLVGTALMLRRFGDGKATRVGEWLILACLVIALFALFGFSDEPQAARMTLGTALLFVILGVGALSAEPERGVMATVASDSAGGVMARRLYPAAIAVPLLVGELALLGECVRLFDGKLGLSLAIATTIVGFAALVALTYRALERTDGQRLRRAAVLLEEAERRHIAKELHDEIGQSLTALNLRLQALPSSEPVLETRAMVTELIARVSNLSLDLRPAMLDDLGLLPALLWLVERYTAQTGVQVQLTHAGLEGRLAPAVETAAFRIVQEALTNVARHAAVTQATVRVWRDAERVSVQISDGGKGFDVAGALAGGRAAGLSGMRERAVALGGSLVVESSPSGTFLSAELPLATTARDAGRV